MAHRNMLASAACLARALLILLVLPSAPVLAVDKTAWPIPDWIVATPESQGLDGSKLDALRAYFEEKGTRAALVIRHGRLVVEWYWDGKDRDTLFPVYSVTKSFTSTAIGLLVADGKVKLDEPAADFIPTWKADDRKAITIRHLLSMTSGLKQVPDIQLAMRRDQLDFALAQPLTDAPGTTWEYNNPACQCLSEIITRASGQEMADFLKQSLYDRLGIRHVEMDRNGGRTLAYMGLRISARDLARVGLLFLRRGLWNGKRILPESWIACATHPSQKLNPVYGLLWWVSDPRVETNGFPPDSFSAIGLYGNYLTVVPSKDMIIVRLIGGGSGRLTDVEMPRFTGLALAAVKD